MNNYTIDQKERKITISILKVMLEIYRDAENYLNDVNIIYRDAKTIDLRKLFLAPKLSATNLNDVFSLDPTFKQSFLVFR